MTLVSNPFEIDPKEIAQLDTQRLVQLLNVLLRNEGVKLGLPANEIKLTSEINAPDGGIDLVIDCTQAGTGAPRQSQYLDPGITVVQYKKSWPSAAKAKKELRKPKVQDAFKSGANYVLMVGANMTPATQTSRENDLREWAKTAGCKGTARLYVSDHMAGWASEVPAARAAFRPEIRDFLQTKQFLDHEPRHKVPFEPDDSRRDLMSEVALRLFGESPATTHVRISGLAGVGKSRLALEIVKAAGLEELSLYSSNVPTSRELFIWTANNPNIQTTVIVDECDDAQALELEELARQCDGRLKLITAGAGLGTGQDVYRLPPLHESAMEEVVRVAAPTLPKEQVRWIAEKTEGYVKLAILVTQHIAAGRTEIASLRSDREIAHFISAVIAPDPDQLRALQGVALLTSVGWMQDVRDEGVAISKFRGIPWERMQSLLQPLIREGIIVPRGRFWYVSPELLAIWLAADVWEPQAHRISELLESLPSVSARERLTNRASQLGGVPTVRQVLEVILSASGPFDSLESLSVLGATRLFTSVSDGAPDAGLRALDRMIGPASHDELLGFTDSRQEIVWLLSRLLERRETFWTAARLLRQLAEAENASWANNATGTWQSIFLTMLGPTEVPAIDRMKLIDEALGDDSQDSRLLGVKGLASALQTREIGMGRGSSGGSIPPEYWSPKKWDDVWEVKRAALALLDRAMEDPAPDIRRAARDVLLGASDDLVAINLGEDVVQRLVGLTGEDESERRKIWETINYVLKYRDAGLSADQKERLQRASIHLYGESLVDQIKKYVGLPRYQLDLFSDNPEIDFANSLRRLAHESLTSQSEFRRVLPWLVSAEAAHAFEFGRYLGEMDASASCLESLVTAVKGSKNPEILSGYLTGHAGAETADWRNEILDGWSEDSDMALAVFDATMRGPRSDQAVDRILQMIDDGLLDTQVLGWMQYGSWANAMSESRLMNVLSRLLDEGTTRSVTIGLALCSDWFKEAESKSNGVSAIAWSLLEHPSGWTSEPMLALYWTEVAKRVAPENPSRAAELVVDSYVEGEATLGDRRIEVLGEIISSVPDRVWPVIGEAILNRKNAFRLSWILEESGLVLRVPPEIVIQWVRDHGEKGAEAIASLVKPGESDLPEIVRFLIENYYSNVDGVMAANFRSGSWSGSEAGYLEPKLAIAQEWAKDQSPAVRRWANNVVAWLESDIARAKLSDEEWDLR